MEKLVEELEHISIKDKDVNKDSKLGDESPRQHHDSGTDTLSGSSQAESSDEFDDPIERKKVTEQENRNEKNDASKEKVQIDDDELVVDGPTRSTHTRVKYQPYKPTTCINQGSSPVSSPQSLDSPSFYSPHAPSPQSLGSPSFFSPHAPSPPEDSQDSTTSTLDSQLTHLEVSYDLNEVVFTLEDQYGRADDSRQFNDAAEAEAYLMHESNESQMKTSHQSDGNMPIVTDNLQYIDTTTHSVIENSQYVDTTTHVQITEYQNQGVTQVTDMVLLNDVLVPCCQPSTPQDQQTSVVSTTSVPTCLVTSDAMSFQIPSISPETSKISDATDSGDQTFSDYNLEMLFMGIPENTGNLYEDDTRLQEEVKPMDDKELLAELFEGNLHEREGNLHRYLQKYPQILTVERFDEKSLLCLSANKDRPDVVRFVLSEMLQLFNTVDITSLLKCDNGNVLHCVIRRALNNVLSTILGVLNDQGFNDVLVACLRCCDDDGFTPIQRHLYNCSRVNAIDHYHILETLLSFQDGGAETVDQKQGQNAVHFAVKFGNTAALKTILSKVDNEKVLNVQDTEGNTPLHLAASLNHAETAVHREIVEILANKYRASTNINNRRNQAPAALVSKDRQDIKKIITNARRRRR